MTEVGRVELDLKQVENDLEQIENDLRLLGGKLIQVGVAYDLLQVQAKHGEVEVKPSHEVDPFEQFELAENDFKKVKLALKQLEDKRRKLGANERSQIAPKLKQVTDRFEQLKDRHAKVIDKLEQVEDEPTIFDFMGFERFAKTMMP